MSKNEVLRKLREKLAKLHVYNNEAYKLYGPEVAKTMFHTDLDFLATVIGLVGPEEESVKS